MANITNCSKCIGKCCYKFASSSKKPQNCEYCEHNIIYHDINAIKNSDSYEALRIYIEPSEIIDGVYMGSILAALDEANLKNIGITHIVNCVGEFSYNFLNYRRIDGIKYLELDMGSSKKAVLGDHPGKTTKFIEDCIKNGGKILVHCKRGISRSGSIIIAYIMSAKNIPYQEAFDLVKRKRHVCKPNINLINQLESMYE